MDALIQGVFTMAVYSVRSTRIASAATAVPKAATAMFIVVSNGNTDEGYFQETLGHCSQWHIHCKITWRWIEHLQNNILTTASVWSYHYSLRNNPEWRSIQLFRNYEMNCYRKGVSWRRLQRVWLGSQCIKGKGNGNFPNTCWRTTYRTDPVTYSYTQTKRPLYSDVISNQLNINFQPPSYFSHRQFYTATPHVH